MKQIGSLVQLTFDSDAQLAKRLTDHKQFFLNGSHFITFSVAGDSDLYIFKANKDGQHVFINKYQIKSPTRAPVEWKSYFTLKPEEGRVFSLDSTAIIPRASVPGINIANDGRVILGYAGQGGRGQAITGNQGRTFTPLTNFARAQAGDGAFIYLPDSRTRYITEEPLRTSTPQRHKSRLVSWISYDGINWSRESGVRYQPGGIAFTDGDGVVFDTTQTKLLLADGAAGFGLLLDPAVIKFPNGEVACYIGATPPFNQPGQMKIVAAWAQKTTTAEQREGALLPSQFELFQNYPNPFSANEAFGNPRTIIRFSLPQRAHVTLKIFDLLGKEIAAIVADELDSGEHTVPFSANALARGVYFCRLQFGNHVATRKMLVK